MPSKKRKNPYAGWTDPTINSGEIDNVVDKILGKYKPPQTRAHETPPESKKSDAHLVSKTYPVSDIPGIRDIPGISDIPGIRDIPAKKGFLQIPHELSDDVFMQLDPYEFATYYRLYRLSYGFGHSTCKVSLASLARATNCDKQTTRRALRNLTQKGLIVTEGINNSGTKDGGTVFRVNQKIAGTCDTPGMPDIPGVSDIPGIPNIPIKDHDDDFKNKDHHQSEMMRIYQTLTGNSWTKADEAAYQKIKNVLLEKIEQGIRLASQRAASRPNSLAYFVKEILNLAQPSAQSKAQRKKALEQIVARVRELHAGAHDYGMSDFVEDIKMAAAREGVAYDADLLSEILKT